jgi:hypothetical protein
MNYHRFGRGYRFSSPQRKSFAFLVAASFTSYYLLQANLGSSFTVIKVLPTGIDYCLFYYSLFTTNNF